MPRLLRREGNGAVTDGTNAENIEQDSSCFSAAQNGSVGGDPGISVAFNDGTVAASSAYMRFLQHQ
ncbi:MAG: hypothetical protein IIW17_03055 [Clostridia bacterium]|nr:hypothetical protein [Clostridia bacterium]MBQ2255944.1 hypothetical protein [Clostridia bacterium]MBQ5792975.1 hypothetical protein [Clostridia bacterium]